jgi:hypothetical protein
LVSDIEGGYGQRVFENRVLRIFGLKWDEVTALRKKLRKLSNVFLDKYYYND